MSKSKRRQFLEGASANPKQKTHFIDPAVTRKLSIIFSFKLLDVSREPFRVDEGDGEGLLYIFNTMKIFSQIERHLLEISYPKCHPVPEDQIKTHHLSGVSALSPSGKLHQIGRNSTPERIVGFFDSPIANLFNVCFLDLHHNLSGD